MIYTLIIGALVGFLAGKIMKGGGFGAFKNIVLGVFGGFVGGWLLEKAGLPNLSGVVGDVSRGLIGALAILFVFSLFKNK